MQLWPEHFDVALTIGDCTLGGSPGDADHPEPYLYVGPWEPARIARTNPYWNEPFGASMGWRADMSAADAVAFFSEGLARLHAV